MIFFTNPQLLYTVRKKELEQMFNDIGHVGSLRGWNIDAVNCYKRGCICEGCPIKKLVKSLYKCQMKASVLELVKLYGIPKRNGPNY